MNGDVASCCFQPCVTVTALFIVFFHTFPLYRSVIFKLYFVTFPNLCLREDTKLARAGSGTDLYAGQSARP